MVDRWPMAASCSALKTSHPVMKVSGAFWGDMLVAVETPTGFVGLTQVIKELGIYVTGLTGAFVDLL